MKRTVAGITALLLSTTSLQSATLLPNGQQQFINGSGVPYASGKVYFYSNYPTCSILKNTWSDNAGSVLNTNPVILDSAGRATIFGSGAYCQVLKDSNDNTIWTKYTSDTSSASNLGWGGTSGGTANAQTLSVSTFTQVDGQTLYFIAGTTNTSSMTLNVNSSGAAAVVKTNGTTTSFLTGFEVVAGSVIGVTYVAATGQFQLITNPSVQPPGEVASFAMSTCPAGWLAADGTAYSRSTYAGLFGKISTTWGTGDGSTTFNVPDMRGAFVRGWDNSKGLDVTVLGGVTTSGSSTVTGLSSTNLMYVGMPVSGTGIPSGTTVASIVSGTSVTLSANATATSGVLSGTTTLGTFALSGLSSTSNLSVGQSVSGTGLLSGAVITSINSSSQVSVGTVYAGTFASAATTISGISNTAGMVANQSISGPGIAANTVISSITNSTTIVVSNPTVAAGTGVSLTFGPVSSGTNTMTFASTSTPLTFTGRAFGSYEADQYLNHSHGASDPGHKHGTYFVLSTTGGTSGNYYPTSSSTSTFDTTTATTGLTVNTSTTGGSETRPKNYSLLYCIKY
jgi:microcystin-dependent protein